MTHINGVLEARARKPWDRAGLADCEWYGFVATDLQWNVVMECAVGFGSDGNVATRPRRKGRTHPEVETTSMEVREGVHRAHAPIKEYTARIILIMRALGLLDQANGDEFLFHLRRAVARDDWGPCPSTNAGLTHADYGAGICSLMIKEADGTAKAHYSRMFMELELEDQVIVATTIDRRVVMGVTAEAHRLKTARKRAVTVIGELVRSVRAGDIRGTPMEFLLDDGMGVWGQDSAMGKGGRCATG